MLKPATSRCALAAAALILLLPARALPPAVTITNVVRDDAGVTLGWAANGPGLEFTVESRDALESAGWAPVPGTAWPAAANRVLDPRPGAAARFYRVTFQPAPAERGKLLSAVLVRALTKFQIQLAFTVAGFPVTADKEVRFHKLVYETVDAHGRRTVASGALALPVGVATPLPLVSYQHGSILLREDVPSRLNSEGYLGVAFATSGYAAVLPDYLGLGDSPGLHPYHHAASEATAVVDLLRAARTYCAANGVALDGRLFLAGYSQGGHATLAAQREIEARHAAEFPLTAVAAGAGAYDLSGVTADDFLQGGAAPNPYYLPYLLAAYVDVYGLAGSPAELLAPPYDVTVAPFFDGAHAAGEINARLPAAYREALRPDYVTAFAQEPEHPLRHALRDNDLLDWTPRTPLRLYHCAGDKDVPPANARAAYDRFVARGATQVTLLDPQPAAGHGDCVEPTLLAIKAWFDALR